MKQFLSKRSLLGALLGLAAVPLVLNIIAVWAVKTQIVTPLSPAALGMTISGAWTYFPPDPRSDRVSLRFREFTFKVPPPTVSLSMHPRGLVAWINASAALMLFQNAGDSDCVMVSRLRQPVKLGRLTLTPLTWLGLPPAANDFDFLERACRTTPDRLSYLGWLPDTVQTGALLALKAMLVPFGRVERILEWHGNGLDALVFLGSEVSRLQVFDRARHRGFEAMFLQNGISFWSEQDIAAILRSLATVTPEERKAQKQALLEEGRQAFAQGDYQAASLAYAQFHANFSATIDMEAHRNMLESVRRLRPKSVEGVLKDLKRRLATDTAAFTSLSEGK